MQYIKNAVGTSLTIWRIQLTNVKPLFSERNKEYSIWRSIPLWSGWRLRYRISTKESE